MTLVDPTHDSALEAVGDAFRVVTRPGFLWAPILLAVLVSLPLLALPSAADRPPTFDSQAALDAYLRTVVMTGLASGALSLLLGPILAAVQYRLAGRFLDGAPPAPFASGIVGLAWRFFLQTALFLLVVAALLAVLAVLAVVLERVVGIGLAVLIAVVTGFAVAIVMVLRLGIAPAMLIRGHGPVEAIREAWKLTRGRYAQMARWWFVTGLLLAIIAGVIGGASSAIFATIRLPQLGQVVNAMLVAPIGLVSAIVFVRLTRLLAGDPPPEPAAPPMRAAPAADDASDHDTPGDPGAPRT